MVANHSKEPKGYILKMIVLKTGKTEEEHCDGETERHKAYVVSLLGSVCVDTRLKSNNELGVFVSF